MKQLETDVAIIGAGGAGWGAALSARAEGAVALVVERLDRPGGILQQCIHDGFGLQRYKSGLTGPEYAARLQAEADAELTFLPERFVKTIDTEAHQLVLVSPSGVEIVHYRTLVYAAGARERPFGSLLIPGDRVSGILTAGVAQRLVNLDNRRPGTRAVVLGSGDIGLIMARRLTLEGIEVQAVLERLPYPGGLERNRVQCLEDFGIPLLTSTTVAEVRGHGRLSEVVTVKVDENANPITGTERSFAVDTLVLSVGLVPSTTPLLGTLELDPHSRGVVVDSTMGTSCQAVFSAGNCTAIYDLVDEVTSEGETAGRWAARVAAGRPRPPRIPLVRGPDVGVLNPSLWCPGEPLTLYVRPSRPIERGRWHVTQGQTLVAQSRWTKLMPSEMTRLTGKTTNLDPQQPVLVEVERG